MFGAVNREVALGLNGGVSFRAAIIDECADALGQTNAPMQSSLWLRVVDDILYQPDKSAIKFDG